METHNIQLDIQEAITNRNAEDLYDLAVTLKEQGDDEGAEHLRDIIKDWNNEDWAYDRAVDEALLNS